MELLNFKCTKTKVSRFVLIFFFLDLSFFVSYIINSLFGYPFGVLARLLNFDGGGSLYSWYTSIKFFCIFILSAAFAHYKFKENRKSFLLYFLPVLFLLLSIEESVRIHEWLGCVTCVLGGQLGTDLHNSKLWMLIYGLPFLVLFLFWGSSVKKYISDNPTSYKKLVLGMCLMLLGALGLNIISTFLEHSIWWLTAIVVEEGFEMIGATVMLWAVYETAEKYIRGVHG